MNVLGDHSSVTLLFNVWSSVHALVLSRWLDPYAVFLFYLYAFSLHLLNYAPKGLDVHSSPLDWAWIVGWRLADSSLPGHGRINLRQGLSSRLESRTRQAGILSPFAHSHSPNNYLSLHLDVRSLPLTAERRPSRITVHGTSTLLPS